MTSIDSVCALAACLVAVMKHPDKSNLREKRFAKADSSSMSALTLESCGDRSLKQIHALHPGSGSIER